MPATRWVTYPRRDIVDAIRYLAHNGNVWAALPADFPHPKHVYHYFKTWTRDGTLNRMHNSLREQTRQADGRAAMRAGLTLRQGQALRARSAVCSTSGEWDQAWSSLAHRPDECGPPRNLRSAPPRRVSSVGAPPGS